MLEQGASRCASVSDPTAARRRWWHTEITDADGAVIGRITSGGFGPTLNAPVAMGYVPRVFAADGTKLSLLVRGKPLPARVAPMPFVPHRYTR